MNNVVAKNGLILGFVKCTYDIVRSVFGEPTDITNEYAKWQVVDLDYGDRSPKGNGVNINIAAKISGGDIASIYDNTDWGVYSNTPDGSDIFSIIRDKINTKLGDISKYAVRYDVVKFY